MRHATVNATLKLFDWLGSNHDIWRTGARRACDWSPTRALHHSDVFGDFCSEDLLQGKSVELPTCPACALLLDEALRLAGLTGGENMEATVSP